MDDSGREVLFSNATAVNDYAGTTILYPPFFSVRATSPFSCRIEWTHVAGAIVYKINSSSGGSYSTDSNSLVVYDLLESEPYTFSLLSSSDGATFVDSGLTTSLTTPVNTSLSFDRDSFLSDTDVYDVTSFSSNRQDEILRLAADIFTGSIVTYSGRFYLTADSLTLDSWIMPFGKNDGAGQNVVRGGLISSGSAVTYDDVGDTVTIDGTTVSTGQSTVVDGIRVRVVEI